MAYSEDHIALAAEYALGTLDADERAQVETMMAVDTEFTAIVHAWEYRLGVLNQMVGSIEPRRSCGKTSRPRSPFPREPGAAGAARGAAPSSARRPGPWPSPLRPRGGRGAARRDGSVERQFERHSRWRAGRAAGAVSASRRHALAAALIGMLAVQVYRPELLPDGLRPKPRIQTVEGQDAGALAGALGAIRPPCCSVTGLARLHPERSTPPPKISPSARSAPMPSPARVLSSG
jgi:hypothetical protein